MSEMYQQKPTRGFWIVAALFVVWNLMGCGIYLLNQTMSDAAYAKQYGAAMAAVRDMYPVWGISAYAIAVWGGLLAALLMLLRRSACVPMFGISLIAAIISFVPQFTNEILQVAAGDKFWVMPAIVVVLGLFELFYAARMKSRDVLR